MTSGNIRMGPDPDDVLAAVRRAVGDDPKLRRLSAEAVAPELVRGGYLEEEPDPVLVAEALGTLDPEEPDDEPGIESEEANPT